MPSPVVRELRSLLIGLLAFAWLVVPIISHAEEGTSTPTLRVETGMHTAQVSGLSADPKGRWIVTGSDDKTVRVWETATGRMLKTLRPPIGDGAEGKIYAVAVSPDGKTIACGGYTNAPGQGGCLYLFDRASGQIRQRIVGLPNVTLALAYSQDGRYLAAGLGLHGLSVFHADGTAAAQDAEYKDSCYGIAFDKSGRLVTASLDGYLRLYDAKFQRLARKPAPDGRFPFSAAFSPDGTQIAVGYYDTPKVSLVSGSDLSARTAPDTKDITNGSLRHVAWSPDGRFLYAAGTYQKQGRFLIRRWSQGGGGTPTDMVSGAHNTVAAVYPLTGSTLAWSGASPSWGLLDGTASRLTFQSRAPDYAGISDAFRLSDDGSVVQYQDTGQDRALTRFSLPARVLSPGTPGDDALAPPKTQAPGLDITDWNGGPTPKLGGKTLTLAGHEAAHCLAIAPSGRQFILGTTEQVRCYNSAGTLQWQVPAPEISWAVNVSGNGKVCAAAFGDGTIHWYRMSDGQEQLALFPDADRKRWLAWTRQGFYDCSPGGEDFIGWHINRGWTQSADFFPAGRFRSAYDRPAVIASALGPLASAPNQSLPLVAQNPPPVTHILPPVIRILSPEDGTAVSTAQVTLRYTVRTPSGEPASVVHALIDGRPASDQRDLHIVSSSDSPSQQITVTIPARDCEVSLIAENRYAPSEPAVIQLKWQGAGDSSAKPKLYVLAIGVSKYHDPSINLQYGASDASDFAKTMLAQNGSLYSNVQEKILTDGTATKANILAGLRWIRTQTTGKDVAMIFIAGHGANDPASGNYLFIPQDFNQNKPLQTAVPYTDIKATVQSIPGKALFFIDTCHAGNVMGTTRSVGSAESLRTLSCTIVRPRRILAAGNATPFGGVPDVTSVINELSSAENGVVVFSASTGNQVSFEDASWGHGAFTKALVEALTGGADYQHTGRITVNMLDLYLSERVKALTKGAQTPTTTKPETVPDFPVALTHT